MYYIHICIYNIKKIENRIGLNERMIKTALRSKYNFRWLLKSNIYKENERVVCSAITLYLCVFMYFILYIYIYIYIYI